MTGRRLTGLCFDLLVPFILARRLAGRIAISGFKPFWALFCRGWQAPALSPG